MSVVNKKDCHVICCKSNAKYASKPIMTAYCKLKFASIWYVCFAYETYSYTAYLSVDSNPYGSNKLRSAGSKLAKKQTEIMAGSFAIKLTDAITRPRHMSIRLLLSRS